MMSKILIIAIATILLSISACAPFHLSDKNDFFVKFVSQELLSALGVMLTIVISLAAYLHFELNNLEEKTGGSFDGTRSKVKLSVNALLVVFVCAFIVVIVKPIVANVSINLQAVFNSFSIIFMAINISVLIDLSRTIFKIPAVKKKTDKSDKTKQKPKQK